MRETLHRLSRPNRDSNVVIPTISSKICMADLLEDLPPIVERRVVLLAINSLLPRSSTAVSKSTMGAIAAVLLAQSGNCLTVPDIADIAERLMRSSKGLYFKPQSDGTSHFTVKLEIADGVVVSLVQLDDNARTAATCAILALLLMSLDDVIRTRLLDTERIPRNEAVINVASRTVFEAHVGSRLLNLGEMANGFAIAQSTDFTREDQPPILVLCSDDFPIRWAPNQHALSDVHLAFGELLRVLIGHLLAHSVEGEVLFPKISSIMRRISYQGPTLRLYPREASESN